MKKYIKLFIGVLFFTAMTACSTGSDNANEKMSAPSSISSKIFLFTDLAVNDVVLATKSSGIMEISSDGKTYVVRGVASGVVFAEGDLSYKAMGAKGTISFDDPVRGKGIIDMTYGNVLSGTFFSTVESDDNRIYGTFIEQ